MTIFSNQKDIFLMFLIFLRIKGAQRKEKCFIKLAFSFLSFPEIPEISETRAHKIFHLNTTAKLKCRKLWYFD